MNLLSTTIWSGAATVFRLGSGLIVAKVVALEGGPAAVAMFGQFQNFLLVISSLAGTLLQTGLVKYAAEYREQSGILARILATVLRLAAGIALAGSIVLIAWHEQVTIWVMRQPDLAPLYLFAGVMLPMLVINGLALGFLNGMGHIRHYLVLNALTSLVNMLAVLLFILWAGVRGAMYGLLIGPLIAGVIAAVFAMRLHGDAIKAGLSTSFDRIWAGNLGRFAAMSVASMLATPLVQIGIRNAMVDHLGWHLAGYWQAVTQVSNAYLAVVTAGFAVYYLPKLSRLSEIADIRQEMLRYYRTVMPLVFVLSALVYLLRRQILSLLYSNEFLPAADLFGWQMAGNVVKITSFVMAYMLIAKGMTLLTIGSELMFGALNYFSNLLLIPVLGIKAPVIIYFCMYLLYAAFCWSVIGRYYLMAEKPKHNGSH
jgi:PST family polysaccharide transporter